MLLSGQPSIPAFADVAEQWEETLKRKHSTAHSDTVYSFPSAILDGETVPLDKRDDVLYDEHRYERDKRAEEWMS